MLAVDYLGLAIAPDAEAPATILMALDAYLREVLPRVEEARAIKSRSAAIKYR